jgi:hypothetical protein
MRLLIWKFGWLLVKFNTKKVIKRNISNNQLWVNNGFS